MLTPLTVKEGIINKMSFSYAPIHLNKNIPVATR